MIHQRRFVVSCYCFSCQAVSVDTSCGVCYLGASRCGSMLLDNAAAAVCRVGLLPRDSESATVILVFGSVPSQLQQSL